MKVNYVWEYVDLFSEYWKETEKHDNGYLQAKTIGDFSFASC